MPTPKVGTRYTCRAEKGLAGDLVDDELSREMSELDMSPGTVVTVVEIDKSRPVSDLILVEWTDDGGNPRMTSIDPDEFSGLFVKAR